MLSHSISFYFLPLAQPEFVENVTFGICLVVREEFEDRKETVAVLFAVRFQYAARAVGTLKACD